MKAHAKAIEPTTAVRPYHGPYQEIAIHVRELLQCEYALVALLERTSIRIQGLAGQEGESYENFAMHLILRLRDWGPAVVDDAHLIVAPVSSNGTLMGALIGYSSKPSAFTTGHLEKLMTYAPVAAGMFACASVEERSQARATLRTDGLPHFFRLITVGEFSACFAHEVRNPLTLIRGHLRLIDESLPANDPLRSNFEAIDRASLRIEEMAQRMLDFSKKRNRRTESCDVAELIADALRFVQPYVRTKFIDVHVDVEAELPAIDADRWQMVQAVVNLLQNAADAMAGADQRLLSISAGVEKKRVRILISDTGTGIAKAHLAKIFEPFFTTKGDRGTGLGLYITRQVIEEHRGTIDVQTSNRGTTFLIGLPLAP